MITKRSELAAPDGRFLNERELRDYVINNLDLIEPGLRLHKEAQRHREFSCSYRGRRCGSIDVLAEDADGRLVVIECKWGPAGADAIGQILGYITWVRKVLRPKLLPVRGLIIATEFRPILELALHGFDQAPLSAIRIPDRHYLHTWP